MSVPPPELEMSLMSMTFRRPGATCARIVTASTVMLLVAWSAEAQRPEQLTPQVRTMVSVTDPVVALTNVTIIDGTGAAPRRA
ncbi:MAG: hypothetical protein H0X64_14600, partial [Gemmatimonadaceae bacterium]|nr:hypothetical protein [Gemmatimonadaceae bacterium]